MMNSLNFSTAMRLNGYSIPSSEILVTPSILDPVNNYSTRFAPFLSYPPPHLPQINHGLSPQDLVSGPSAPKLLKPTNNTSAAVDTPSTHLSPNPTEQPIDLTVNAKYLPSSIRERSGSSECKKSNSASPLDLTKSAAPAQAIVSGKLERPENRYEKSSSSRSSSRPTLQSANSGVLFRCIRCSFFCGESSEFQKHFTGVHNSVPLLSDAVITAASPPPQLSSQTPALPPSKLPAMPSPIQDMPCLHCSLCGWQCAINQIERFSSHMREHDRDNGSTYQCHYCQKRFHDSNMLREHLSTHPNVYYNVCNLCNLAFGGEGSLSVHMLHRHGLPNYRPHRPVIMDKTPDRSSVSPIRPQSHGTSQQSEFSSTSSHQKSPMFDSSSNSPVTLTPKSEKEDTKPPLTMRKTGFGQSLAKHIEAAINRELIGNKTPTVSDLMFMKSSAYKEPVEEIDKSSDKNSALNLMSLLDKVVEESLRKVPLGERPAKPDMKFMVTFSDDEDSKDSGKEPGTASQKTGCNESQQGTKNECSPSTLDKTEAMVTSSNDSQSMDSEESPSPKSQTKYESSKKDYRKPGKHFKRSNIETVSPVSLKIQRLSSRASEEETSCSTDDESLSSQ